MRKLLIAVLLLGACKTTGSECRRYVKEQNACSRELGDEVFLAPLAADLTCAALNLPGIASDDLRENFTCLADAYADADCSSQEAFAESLSAVCDGDLSDDTDL